MFESNTIVAATSEIAANADITPMNSQILCFGLGDLEQLDAAEMDRRIDETLQAMFDDVDSLSSPCVGYYCTGYWPTSAFSADIDTEIPN